MATEQNQASLILQCSLWRAKWQNYGKVFNLGMTFYVLFPLNLEIQIFFRVHATSVIKAKDSCTKKLINANS